MCQSIQCPSLLNIIEYDLTEFISIKRLIVIEDFIAKMLANFLPYGLSGLNNCVKIDKIIYANLFIK